MPKLPKSQQRLLELLDSGYHYTLLVLRQRTGICQTTLRTHLRTLKDLGMIREYMEPKSRNTYRYVRVRKP